MRFLRKQDQASAAFDGLQYGPDTPAIRELLLVGQKGFCAYTEKFREPLDSIDVEHFDPRLKHTPDDSCANWFAVIGKINQRRARKIDRFLPLPDPGSDDVQRRITFDHGEFCPVDSGDEEIERLIRYIRANDELTVQQRDAHAKRIADLQTWMSPEELKSHLIENPALLSFPSALESKLGLPVFEWIESHFAKSLECRAKDA